MTYNKYLYLQVQSKYPKQWETTGQMLIRQF